MACFPAPNVNDISFKRERGGSGCVWARCLCLTSVCVCVCGFEWLNVRVSITGPAAQRCRPSTTKQDSIPNEGLIILPTWRRDVHCWCAHENAVVDDLIHARTHAACPPARRRDEPRLLPANCRREMWTRKGRRRRKDETESVRAPHHCAVYSQTTNTVCGKMSEQTRSLNAEWTGGKTDENKWGVLPNETRRAG